MRDTYGRRKQSWNCERRRQRRDFFLKLGLGSLGIAAAGTVAFAYQFLEPEVLDEPLLIVNEGQARLYPLDSVTLDANSGIYIIRAGGLFLTERRMHDLGCLTAWKPS